MTTTVPCPIETTDSLYSPATRGLLAKQVTPIEMARAGQLLALVQWYTRDDFDVGLPIKSRIDMTQGPKVKPIDRNWWSTDDARRRLLLSLQYDEDIYRSVALASGSFETTASVTQFKAIYLQKAIILVAMDLTDAVEKISDYSQDSLSSIAKIIIEAPNSNHAALTAEQDLQSVLNFANQFLRLSNGADDLELVIPGRQDIPY